MPPGVKAAPVKVAGTANEAKFPLTVPAKTKPGNLTVTIQAAAKHEGRDWIAKALAVKGVATRRQEVTASACIRQASAKSRHSSAVTATSCREVWSPRR